MKMLNFNGIFSQGQVMWELGMGVPFLAMFYCVVFKKVVATDISIGIYTSVVNTLESLADYQSLSTPTTPSRITKVIKCHLHKVYVENTAFLGRQKRSYRSRKVKLKKKIVKEDQKNNSDSDSTMSQSDGDEEYANDEDEDDDSSSSTTE